MSETPRTDANEPSPQRQIRALQVDLEDARSTIATLCGQLDTAQARLAHCEKQLTEQEETAQILHDSWHKRLDAHREAKAALETENAGLKQQLAALEGIATSRAEDRTRIGQENNKLRQQLDTARARVSHCENHREVLVATLAEANAKLANTCSALTVQGPLIMDPVGAALALREERDALKQQLADAQRQIEVYQRAQMLDLHHEVDSHRVCDERLKEAKQREAALRQAMIGWHSPEEWKRRGDVLELALDALAEPKPDAEHTRKAAEEELKR